MSKLDSQPEVAELNRRREITEDLKEVLAVLNSNQRFDEVLGFIISHAKNIFDAVSIGIYRIDIRDERIVISPSKGTIPDALTELKIPAEGSIVSETLLRKKPLIITDSSDIIVRSSPILPDDEQRAHLRALLSTYRAVLAVPLIIKNELYGGIALYFKTPREFSNEDVSLALTIGDQTALAIENAIFYEQTERRTRVAESLRDIMVVLNSNLPINEILDLIVKQASNLLGASAVAVYKLFPKEGLLRIQASDGLSVKYSKRISIPVGEAAVGRAVLTRKPVKVYDITTALPLASKISADPTTLELMNKLVQTYRSVLAVPLLIKNEVYGGIILYYPEPREYSAEEVDLASTFANHVALAIEHERLDRQSKDTAIATERNRLAHELHDAVTQTLFSSSLIAEVLPKIWEKNPEEGSRRLEELRQLTKDALAEMRALLLELRPAVIVEADLSDLIRQLAEAATRSSRIPIDVKAVAGVRLPDDAHLAFYRITQEAINNIVKHSAASKAAVSLTDREGVITLRISDNGRGFEKSKVSPESLGMGIMSERAETVGAKLEVKSKPGHGTTITAVWTV